MFSLTRLFVRRPTLVFVLVSLMLFAGVMATVTIVKQYFPNAAQPAVTIGVTYNGASVAEMRDNIVAPIEQALAGTTDLQTFSATVQQGQATITATFLLGSDQATDLALTQKDLQSAERQLPTNLTPPSIAIRDPSESTVVTLGLFSKTLRPGTLSLYVDNVIVPQFEQIPGVSYASVGGDVTPAYEIEVDPNKLASSGLTLTDVIQTVTNGNSRVPGGIAYEANRETVVDVRGDIVSPQSVARLPIQTAGSAATNATGSSGSIANGVDAGVGVNALPGTVDPWTASNAVRRIEDVANVIAGYEPRRQFAQVNGRPGLFLQIQKTSDASEVDASEAVIHALPLLRKKFPLVDFDVVNVQANFTNKQIELVVRTLFESILLTGVAMIFFLRSWRNALVVCVSIPTSLAIAISAMKLLHFTIDVVSLLGMTLVIGILVDDSTVVLENIERHHTELGASPAKAAIEGREEIGAAAVVITLVDVVVFTPIAFIGGQVGANLVEFAIVVVISTLTSLFVSFTVTPTLAGLWALKSHWKPPFFVDWFTSAFDRLRDWYSGRALPWALGHRWIVVGFCLLSFVGSMLLVPLGIVGEEFVPATDRGQIYIQSTYPIGTPVRKVADGIFAVEREVLKDPDVQAEATTAGGYSASFGGYVIQGNVGQVTIFLKDDRAHSTVENVATLRTIVNRVIPKATNVVVPSTGSQGGNKQPIDYLVTDLTGGDPTPYAQKALDLLKTIPGATSVNGNGTSLAPEVSIEFDRAKLQALDVSLATAANAVGAAFGGDVATQFETEQGLEQVQVIYPLDQQHELDALKTVPIRAQNGAIVHMGDFITLKSTPTAPLVTRTDRDTVIHLNANLGPGASLSSINAAFFAKVASLDLPPTISIRPAPLGQQDFMNQVLQGIGRGLVLSVILVFLLMVALYNSYRSPLIIIFSVPVAAVGALGGLVLTHKTLNIFSLIGTMLLVGIATKNGILLVDYANTLRERGRTRLDAMMESARTRFRPIVMTSTAVMIGNVPLALALEPGSDYRASLGIVIIGGVFSSLVLTLLLVPIMYDWIAPRELPRPSDADEADETAAPEAPPEHDPEGGRDATRAPRPVPVTT